MVVSKFYLSAAPWCKQTLEWAIPEKNQTGELEDILLWKLPWNFSFFYFTPGNSRQNKAQPLDIFYCVRSLGLEIPWPKTKIHGNSTLFFLVHPWKFHFVFNELQEIPCAISLTPLEFPYPQLPCLDFFLEWPNCFWSYIWLFFYYLPIVIADQTRYSIGR